MATIYIDDNVLNDLGYIKQAGLYTCIDEICRIINDFMSVRYMLASTGYIDPYYRYTDFLHWGND